MYAWGDDNVMVNVSLASQRLAENKNFQNLKVLWEGGLRVTVMPKQRALDSTCEAELKFRQFATPDFHLQIKELDTSTCS